MSDEGKRTERIQLMVTERVALDLLRAASRDDRSVSDYLNRWLRLHLYGQVRADDDAAQPTTE